jgi:hypothetical protein
MAVVSTVLIFITQVSMALLNPTVGVALIGVALVVDRSVFVLSHRELPFTIPDQRVGLNLSPTQAASYKPRHSDSGRLTVRS